MPYTAAQLTQYYTALNGTPPDQATQNAFGAFATQNQSGTLSDADTLAKVYNNQSTPNGTLAVFEVIESTYQFFTGSGVSAGGLAFLRGDTGSGNANGLTTAYYTNFNTENRYYNFSINLASAGGAGNAAFVTNYGGLTFSQTVASAYETIVGTSNVGNANAAAAIADISSRQGFFTQIAQQRAGGVDAGGAAGQNIALKAIVVGYILEEANKADVGTYAKAIDQLEASVAAGNAIYGSNILTTYGPGGAGFGTGIGATGQTGTTGPTFAFTTATDVFSSPAGNATFVGAVGGAAPTLGSSDVVNAQGANNTIIINTTGGPADSSGGAILNGVQTVDVRSTDGATAQLNQQAVANSTQLNSYLSTGSVIFNNVTGSTGVGIVGNGAVQGGTVSANFISGTTANVLLQNGVVSASASGAGAQTSVFIGSANGAAATVSVTSAGQANSIDNLVLPAATTTLNIVGNTALTVGGTAGTGTFGSGLTTVGVSGGSAVNLGGNALSNTVRTVTSTNTGGLTATINAPGVATAGLTVTTSTGPDAITIAGTLTATSVINTGGGGDSVVLGGAITAGATINGGGGATLGTTSAVYLGATQGAGAFSAANIAKISGFSTLSITDALTNGSVYDVNLIGAQNFRTVGVAAAGTAALNAAPGATVTFTNGINTNTGTLSIQEAGAQTAAQTNDVLNLVATGQAANNTLNVAIPVSAAGLGIETVNITANRAAGAPAATTTLTLNVADAAAKAYTLAGNENLTFAPVAAHVALTSIVSSSTGIATIDVSAISNSGVGGLSNGTAAAPFTLTTGSGADVLTVRDFVRITADGGADTINALTATNGQSYSSFVDAAAGDKVFLTGANGNVTAANVTAKITLNSTAVFQDYLDAATSGARIIGEVSSFDFGGNTFLVVNNNAAATFQNGSDGLIQLVGTHAVGSITAGVVTLGS